MKKSLYIITGYVLRESSVHVNEDYPTHSGGKSETDSAYLLPPKNLNPSQGHQLGNNF